MDSSRHLHNLALVGFMGTGKSSVGQLVAGYLRFDFVDTDELIERKAGKTITAIFDEDGEAAFRSLESSLVAELTGMTGTVFATGGGLILDMANLESLKQHSLTVCLWASAHTIWQRLRNQSHRPLLQVPNPLATIQHLLAERTPCYRQADILINTEWRSVRAVAHQVVAQFKAASQVAPS